MPHLFGNLLYILDARRRPVPAEPNEWADWIQTGQRYVAHTTLTDGSALSTVFLGIDVARGRMMFETARFVSPGIPGDEVSILQRYSTWAQAEVGHLEWAERFGHEPQEQRDMANAAAKKALADAIVELRAEGWRDEGRSTGKHGSLLHECGARIQYATTPSDRNAAKVMMRRARRVLFERGALW